VPRARPNGFGKTTVRCQACDLKFKERYGVIGKGFIEAHHLRPIASLKEQMAASYDVATDFVVLCANCHRMVHRTADPSDLGTFRKMLKSVSGAPAVP
jgi:5-methylcytosine-specific restriction protein A